MPSSSPCGSVEAEGLRSVSLRANRRGDRGNQNASAKGERGLLLLWSDIWDGMRFVISFRSGDEFLAVLGDVVACLMRRVPSKL